MKKIVYLPLDERPCNYDFAGFISENNKDFNLICPDKSILGDMKIPADYLSIESFLMENCIDADYLILSVDMLLYGGIVPSRLHNLSISELNNRLNLIDKIKKVNSDIKIYAFSLIMRCPSYSGSDEEPDYYEQYGEYFFKLGEICHKFKLKKISKEEYKAEKNICLPICKPYLKDFLTRRKRNLSLNISTLKKVGKSIDYLIIPQDDSAPYGFTAIDQNKVKKVINKYEIPVDIYPGADEVGLTLLAKAVNTMNGYSPKICPIYPKEDCKNVVPLFEDREVYKSIEFQIKNAGCIISDEESADILLFCNLPVGEMHNINNVGGESYDKRDLPEFIKKIKKAVQNKKNVVIADIAYSNGGDLELMKSVSDEIGVFNLSGYAGWNTSSNSLGTAICQGVFSYYYGKTETHKKFLAERVYEDLSFCAFVRRKMYEELLPPMGYGYSKVDALRGECSELAKKLLNKFTKENFPEVYNKYKITDCYMPWIRMFEIGLKVEKK